MIDDTDGCHLCWKCQSPDVLYSVIEEIWSGSERTFMGARSYCKEHAPDKVLGAFAEKSED